MRTRLLLLAICVSILGLGFANGVFATAQPTPEAASPYTTTETTATPCPTFTPEVSNAGTTTTTHTQTPTEPPTGGPCKGSD